MSIFDGGSADQYIGFNHKTGTWTISGEEAKPKAILVDAKSFREGWIRYQPYDAIFPEAESDTVDQPSDDYKKAWHCDAHVADTNVTFRFSSWGLFFAFKNVAPKFKGQADNKLAKLSIGANKKTKQGNFDPVFDFAGFVDKPAAEEAKAETKNKADEIF